MKRLAYEDLLKWKGNPDRKPLIVEGVRQCGKTYLLKEFGRREYANFVYFNFEKSQKYGEVFKGELDPYRIVEDLNKLTSKKIRPNETLLILDEVQSSPRALTAMKYFSEEAPEYHVVCAGSLLGILTSKPQSFPVGNVDRLHMYPMSFLEFVMAMGREELAEYIIRKPRGEKVRQPFHDELVSLLREYYVVGGMPAAVRSWAEHRKAQYVTRILRNIIRDYREDFSNHASDDVPKLTAIWDSIPSQLGKDNDHFLFGEAKKGGRAKDLADSVQWLVDAGLVYKVSHATGLSIPLGMTEDQSTFKLYLADIGVLRVMSGKSGSVDPSNQHDQWWYKGTMTENFVLDQLKASGTADVYYWKDKGSEIDFLTESDDRVVAIEVKAESKVRSSSLGRFIDDNEDAEAILLSMRDRVDDHALPLYCAEMIPRYLDGGQPEPVAQPRRAGAPYRRDFDEGDWRQAGDGFALEIGHAEHGVPAPSIVQTFRRDDSGYSMVVVDVTISLEADVTLRSNSRFPGFVSIM